MRLNVAALRNGVSQTEESVFHVMIRVTIW